MEMHTCGHRTWGCVGEGKDQEVQANLGFEQTTQQQQQHKGRTTKQAKPKPKNKNENVRNPFGGGVVFTFLHMQFY